MHSGSTKKSPLGRAGNATLPGRQGADRRLKGTQIGRGKRDRIGQLKGQDQDADRHPGSGQESGRDRQPPNRQLKEKLSGRSHAVNHYHP